MSKTIKEEFTDVLKINGVKSKGFGIIPKLLMQDHRLTIEAKAIYSYFCSYAGAGSTAFPSRQKICRDLGISIKRYYKHFNLLKEYGYIQVNQKTNGTKFSHNVYTLVEKPEIKPCSQIDHTDKKEAIKPCSQIEHTQIEHTQNDHTNINKSFNNNNSLYNKQSVSAKENTDRQTSNKQETLEEIHNQYKKTYGEEILSRGIERIKKQSVGKKGYKAYLKKILDELQEIEKEQIKVGSTAGSNKFKTKYHLSNSRSSKYTAEELEDKILKKNRNNVGISGTSPE